MDDTWISETVAEGIPADQLELHIQPIATLTDGSIAGGESFVRWMHPQRGMIPPVSWIPAAIDAGVLARAVVSAMDDWPTAAALCPPVSLNVDPAQLATESFRDALFEIEPERWDTLAIEIHHRHLRSIESRPDVLAHLVTIRELGIELWLDDLEQPADMPSSPETRPDRVKLDRGLLSGDGDELPTAVDAVQPLPIIIEGVETHADAERCRALGIEFGQGFLYGPPAPLTSWLHARAG